METTLSIIAIVLSVISGGFAFYTFMWTARRDRKQATLDAYNTLQNEVFDKINLYRPAEVLEISKRPTSKEYNEIGALIARIEHFCVGINMNIYDKKTVYELAHGYFDGSKLKSRVTPIIDRKNNCTDHDYYENIHRVFEWMDRETQKRMRQKS